MKENMRFYQYQPEVSGGYGPNTVYVSKKTDCPIVVSKLHYEFSSWPEDDFQSRFFHFIGTDQLKQAIEALVPRPTGIEFDQVEISGDDDEFKAVWRQGRTDKALGHWHWFKIMGQPGVDDFGMKLGTTDLVVSERVLAVLNKFSTANSVRQITEYQHDELLQAPN